MDILDMFKSEEEIAQEEHNQGQEDGADADVIDQCVHSLNPFQSDEYNEGWDNGVDNQPED